MDSQGPVVSVRLEQLLANATPGKWPANLRGILRFDSRGGGYVDTSDAALAALAPDMARLLIDMGEALRLFLDFFDEETMHTHSPSAMCQKAEALAARLDALGKDTA